MGQNCPSGLSLEILPTGLGSKVGLNGPFYTTSGATEHFKDCHGRFTWLHPKTLAKLSNIHERKITESLEINNLETKAEYDKSIKVLNRGGSNIVNTNSWKPLFRKINIVRHANVMK